VYLLVTAETTDSSESHYVQTKFSPMNLLHHRL